MRSYILAYNFSSFTMRERVEYPLLFSTLSEFAIDFNHWHIESIPNVYYFIYKKFRALRSRLRRTNDWQTDTHERKSLKNLVFTCILTRTDVQAPSCRQKCKCDQNKPYTNAYIVSLVSPPTSQFIEMIKLQEKMIDI